MVDRSTIELVLTLLSGVLLGGIVLLLLAPSSDDVSSGKATQSKRTGMLAGGITMIVVPIIAVIATLVL
jgi:hypothetical protein